MNAIATGETTCKTQFEGRPMAGELKAKGRRVVLNGYNIVPITPGTKFPTFDGWEKTEATPEVVNDWLSNGHAHDDIGVLTRDTPAADLDIWDENARDELLRRTRKKFGRKAPIRFGQEPKCALLFRTDKPFKKIRSPVYMDKEGRKHKVEILGDGQQLVIYAIHPDTNKPYRWVKDRGNPLETPVPELPLMTEELGQWIVDQFIEIANETPGWKQVRKKRDKPAVHDDDDDVRAQRRTPDWERKKETIESALDAIPSSYWGDHDEWIALAMALHWESEGSQEGFELFDEISSRAPKYNLKKTTRQVWDSINNDSPSPKTAGYIYDIAKEEYGWERPKDDDEDGKSPLAYFDAATAELDRTDDDLIDGVLSKGSLALVYGDSSVGKTFFMLHLAYCLASKTEFFERLTTKKGAVLYVAAESGARLKNRVVAIRDSMGEKNAPVRVITSNINLYKDAADLKRIIEAVKVAERDFGMPVIAIVIDTLARATPGMNENASEDMGKAIGRLDRLRNATGAAVVLVHHSGKDQTRGARGWSGLRAAVDHEIEITRDGDIRSADLGSKQRDAKDGSVVTFSLKVVELFERDDGRVATTCVLEELNTDAPRGKRKPLPRSQRAALDILVKLLEEGPVTEKAWRNACIDGRTVSTSEKRDSRKTAFNRAYGELVAANSAFNRAYGELVAANSVSFKGGYVSLPQEAYGDDDEL